MEVMMREDDEDDWKRKTFTQSSLDAYILSSRTAEEFIHFIVLPASHGRYPSE